MVTCKPQQTSLTLVIVGPGTIGASLALSCAIHGHTTILLGRSPASLQKAQQIMDRADSELEMAGLRPDTHAGWQTRISLSDQADRIPSDTDVLIEAIDEDLQMKQNLFRTLEQFVSGKTVLASSTSGLPADEIGKVLRIPERFGVAHFANPPHLMPTVELVPGSQSNRHTMELLSQLVESLDKIPVQLNHDVPGHLFNRIQFAMLREAVSLVEKGIASAEQVDLVVKNGIALRLAEEGPLEKIDLAGLTLVCQVARYLYPELDRSDKPEFLESMLQSGREGASSGQGFYSWDKLSVTTTLERRNAEVVRHLKRKHADDASADTTLRSNTASSEPAP